MNLEKLIQENPNDMELGKKVRDLYLKNKKVFEKYKHLKIYESPDGGNTVYERPFGGDYTTKKLVKE